MTTQRGGCRSTFEGSTRRPIFTLALAAQSARAADDDAAVRALHVVGVGGAGGRRAEPVDEVPERWHRLRLLAARVYVRRQRGDRPLLYALPKAARRPGWPCCAVLPLRQPNTRSPARNSESSSRRATTCGLAPRRLYSGSRRQSRA